MSASEGPHGRWPRLLCPWAPQSMGSPGSLHSAVHACHCCPPSASHSLLPHLRAHMPIFYICVSILALEIGSSVLVFSSLCFSLTYLLWLTWPPSRSGMAQLRRCLNRLPPPSPPASGRLHSDFPERRVPKHHHWFLFYSHP